jgi:8-oxo-dGTP pyrophosphatase MutT (NUDIX family)
MTTRAGDRFHDPALVGLEEAEREFGTPVRLADPEILPRVKPGTRHPFGRHRRSEIVFVLPRPGGLLLHGKSFYPAGLLRLPSGGVLPGEAVLEAARRELREETALVLAPKRFLFHLIQQAEHGQGLRTFHSLGLLYPESSEEIAPTDPQERITELRVVPWDGIQEVIQRLENLDTHWRAWGRFRARPHRLLLQVKHAHPEWFLPEGSPRS